MAGFTWNKRYITFYADFFVLMELDDLEIWDKENGPNKDMLADYIFLPDVNFTWKRKSEMEILVTNRSRECLIRVKNKEHAPVILQHLSALKICALKKCSPIKQPINQRDAVLDEFEVKSNNFMVLLHFLVQIMLPLVFFVLYEYSQKKDKPHPCNQLFSSSTTHSGKMVHLRRCLHVQFGGFYRSC